MARNTPYITPQVLMIREDMRMIEREKEALAREDKVEEETAAPKKTVTVTDLQGLQEIEETGVGNIAQKVVMKKGGMLAMGNENSAQRPLFMEGL